MPPGMGVYAERVSRWQDRAFKLVENQTWANDFATTLEQQENLIAALEHEKMQGRFQLDREHDMPVITTILADQSLRRVFLHSLAAVFHEGSPLAVSFAKNPGKGWDLHVTAARLRRRRRHEPVAD